MPWLNHSTWEKSAHTRILLGSSWKPEQFNSANATETDKKKKKKKPAKINNASENKNEVNITKDSLYFKRNYNALEGLAASSSSTGMGTYIGSSASLLHPKPTPNG